jgi:hypothetical protein
LVLVAAEVADVCIDPLQEEEEKEGEEKSIPHWIFHLWQ